MNTETETAVMKIYKFAFDKYIENVQKNCESIEKLKEGEQSPVVLRCLDFGRRKCDKKLLMAKSDFNKISWGEHFAGQNGGIIRQFGVFCLNKSCDYMTSIEVYEACYHQYISFVRQALDEIDAKIASSHASQVMLLCLGAGKNQYAKMIKVAEERYFKISQIQDGARNLLRIIKQLDVFYDAKISLLPL